MVEGWVDRVCSKYESWPIAMKLTRRSTAAGNDTEFLICLFVDQSTRSTSWRLTKMAVVIWMWQISSVISQQLMTTGSPVIHTPFLAHFPWADIVFTLDLYSQNILHGIIKSSRMHGAMDNTLCSKVNVKSNPDRQVLATTGPNIASEPMSQFPVACAWARLGRERLNAIVMFLMISCDALNQT